MDWLADLGLGVGVEIGNQIERDPAEPAVDGPAADAGELCQRLFAARIPRCSRRYSAAALRRR